MGVQTLHDTGSSYNIPSKYDGGVYATAVSDCVCQGIGDEFSINYSSDSLNVYFNQGSQAIIGGSFFKVTSTSSITLAANSTIYLCANIDLSRPNGERGNFVQRTSSNMRSDNINGSGSSRDLLLYVINTGASGVTSVQDRRVVKGTGSSISGVGIELTSKNVKFSKDSTNFNFIALSEAQYNALSTKDGNTIYFVYEG